MGIDLSLLAAFIFSHRQKLQFYNIDEVVIYTVPRNASITIRWWWNDNFTFTQLCINIYTFYTIDVLKIFICIITFITTTNLKFFKLVIEYWFWEKFAVPIFTLKWLKHNIIFLRSLHQFAIFYVDKLQRLEKFPKINR